MKQHYSRIAAAALTACLAAFLCACGQTDTAEQTAAMSESPSFSQAEVFTLPPEPTAEAQTSAAKADTDGANTTKTTAKADARSAAKAGTTRAETAKESLPDEAEILARVDTARAVYGLFGRYRPEMDKNDAIPGENETVYYRVTDKKFDTMDKLRAYVCGYFSDDVTDALLQVGLYTESDGKLYALDALMPLEIQGDVLSRSAELTAHDKDSQSYRVVLHVDTDMDGKADSDETHAYTCVRQNGRWVFSSFEMF